ncbi:hypothetical protein CEXT_749241 [Caerostris extrusa]|uniref:Uncharacterized protein n=1 Tax=Caerostris extrusa TaxID=172846 RepID=A0AAV4V616_CAEEX|nr:hypothetical protein CEXT_749241 [Caerostris extrusa]
MRDEGLHRPGHNCRVVGESIRPHRPFRMRSERNWSTFRTLLDICILQSVRQEAFRSLDILLSIEMGN